MSQVWGQGSTLLREPPLGRALLLRLTYLPSQQMVLLQARGLQQVLARGYRIRLEQRLELETLRV